MKLSSKGFTLVEALLIGAALILVAAGGYWIYSQNSSDDEPVSEFTDALGEEQQINSFQDCMDWAMPWEVVDDEVVCTAPGEVEFRAPCEDVEEVECDIVSNKTSSNAPEGWVEYTDANTGVRFWHPKDWQVEDNSTADFGLSLSVTSPDFVETPNSVYGGTDKGVFVRIGYQDRDGDKEIDGILNGTDVLSDNYSEVSGELTINGNRGVAYGVGYEGPPSYATIVDADKGFYFIQYTDAPYTDGSTNIKSAKFYDEYTTIVNSFRIN